MAGYGIKKMNWARTMGAYESMTAWRQKRKAFQEKYEAKMQDAVSALQTAWTDVGYNIGEIAANRAVKRIQDEGKAKQEKLQAQLADQNNQPYRPTYSKITETGSAELEGGSKVDLNSNTLTLSNGTVIDLTTGLRRVDVSV
jgi:Skp family chaperone for outer membrane proteins